MRLYHFLSKAWALDDIAKRRLKLSRIDDLNDPFELHSVVLDEPSLREGAMGWKREMAKRYGILCFSRRSTNPVQWGHYADRHRGMCLGFDVPDHSLISVQYVRRRVVADTIRAMLEARSELEAEAAMQKMLGTKYAHWRYEAEMRTFHPLEEEIGGLYFANFGSDLVLREVIVGPLCDASRDEVQQAIGELANVTAHKKRLAYKSFAVVRNRRSDLWK